MSGSWVRDHNCIPVLGAAKTTQGISCNGQMVIPPITPEVRVVLGMSREPGKQKLEKTVWVIPAGALNSVLVLPFYLLTAGISGSSFVHGAGIRNIGGVFLYFLAGFSGWASV